MVGFSLYEQFFIYLFQFSLSCSELLFSHEFSLRWKYALGRKFTEACANLIWKLYGNCSYIIGISVWNFYGIRSAKTWKCGRIFAPFIISHLLQLFAFAQPELCLYHFSGKGQKSMPLLAALKNPFSVSALSSLFSSYSQPLESFSLDRLTPWPLSFGTDTSLHCVQSHTLSHSYTPLSLPYSHWQQ